jgi:hypothetical protein
VRRARWRLDRLSLYPEPIRTEDVRLLVVPWLFRLPWIGRFDGYTIWHLILLREAHLVRDEGLIVHELCHVWQQQHGWVRMWLSYLRYGYDENPYEIEAREAELLTRPMAPASASAAG